MLDVVIEYQNLLENLDQYVADSKFKKTYLIEQLGISRASFYNKLKKRSFSPPEVLKLGMLLFPDEAKALEIKSALERSRQNSINGEVTPHNYVMQKARKKLLR